MVPIPYEWFPGDNTPAPVATECLITFDGDKLYVGFRAHDPEPARVRAHLADRDVPLNDDLIGIQIDTFNDRRRAYQFQVNPLGVQLDALVSDVDATVDYSWDAIWDSAGRLTADGFEVEVAIPFRQLRFPRAGGAQTWGFLATREYPRSEGHQLRSTPHDRNLDCQVCQFQTVTGFQDFDIGHNLEVVPTLTGSRTDQRATLDAPLESGGEDVEAGLNLRWSATPNVALNVAVNPDFSQVEADAAQLNVNERFALFFPEKRPFFLEGADLFSTPLDAVFTRSVADPSFGLKLSGKQGKSAFGVFAAEDRINNLIFPSFETSSLGSVDQDVRSAVVRYRRDLGATSTLGVLYAGRESDDYHNHVYGLDGTLRPTDSDTVRFQVLGSNTLYPDAVAVANDQPVGGFDGTAWQVNYTHNSRHWFWQAFREELDPEFRADSGFITRVGANNTILNFDRIFWGGADSPFSQIKFGCAYQILETTDGRNLEHSGNVVTVYQGRWKQFRVAFGLRPNRESFADVRFDDMRADMRISIRPSGSFYGELFLRGGDDIDVVNIRRIHFKLFQPRVEFKLGRRLDGEVQDQFQTFDFHGEEYLRANLAQATLRYHLNVRTFFRGIFQYRTVDRDLALYNPGINLQAREKEFFTQLLFSYKINPQTVLLAGYSDDDQANDRVPDLTQKNRTFFLKIGYAFLF